MFLFFSFLTAAFLYRLVILIIVLFSDPFEGSSRGLPFCGRSLTLLTPAASAAGPIKVYGLSLIALRLPFTVHHLLFGCFAGFKD